jgi:pentatricopeptide repeat protein
MNEMLGNHYFLTKRFKEAIPQYKSVLVDNPKQILIRKKLIICLLKEGEIKEAIRLFVEMLNEDAEQIFNIQKEEDDCICKQIIFELENNPTLLSDIEKSKVLGILWLFCNSLTSIKYFEKLENEFPKTPIYKDILTKIKSTITNN